MNGRPSGRLSRWCLFWRVRRCRASIWSSGRYWENRAMRALVSRWQAEVARGRAIGRHKKMKRHSLGLCMPYTKVRSWLAVCVPVCPIHAIRDSCVSHVAPKRYNDTTSVIRTERFVASLSGRPHICMSTIDRHCWTLKWLSLPSSLSLSTFCLCLL